MRYFNFALRGLSRKGSLNGLKIICLAAGLALGLVLVAKVVFEGSYDSFYPDSDRVYKVMSNFERDKNTETYGQVSGAIAPAMMRELPEVDCATRYTGLIGNSLCEVGTENKFNAITIFADSMFFEVLPRPIIVGDPRGLREAGQTLISASVAEKLGGIDAAMGKAIMPEGSNMTLTVTGVFEDVPENSSLRYDVVSSVYVMPQWSLENWVGNDRYRAYARLKKDVDADAMAGELRKMQERNVDMEMLKNAGVDIFYTLTPLSEVHSADDGVRNVRNVMLLMAIVIMALAVFNYVLLVVSTMLRRAKTTAVEKCYGASSRDIVMKALAEGALHLGLALLLAFVMLIAFHGQIEKLLGTTLLGMVMWPTVLIAIAISVIVLFVAVSVPAWMFLRVPVAQAFRGGKESRRGWKLSLLFLQFACVACLVTVLSAIGKQYAGMITVDSGYDYERIVLVDAGLLDRDGRKELMQEISALSAVEEITISSSIPMDGPSGNNAWLPNEERELFNCADLYYADENFASALGIDIIDGKGFVKGKDNSKSVIVSETFADKMRENAGWTGSPVGREVCISEHSQGDADAFVIAGVYADILLGSLKNPDERPSVIFCDDGQQELWPPSHIMARVSDLTPEVLGQIRDIVETRIPDHPEVVSAYIEDMGMQYEEERSLRDSIAICGFVSMLIAVAGIAGYSIDEINRRRREIAIRKVNGATSANVLALVGRDITKVAIPALAVGVCAGYIGIQKWLSNFSVIFQLSWWQMLLIWAALYALIIACVAWQARKASMMNPTQALNSDQ